MARKVVILRGDESSVLEEVVAHDEEQLQERLKANPDLLPIEDFGMTGPLVVIGRETSLPSGSVDLVGLARGGELLIIEFKTGPDNPDFRGAFAQLIDYGSDIWEMSYEVFESTVPLRYFASHRCRQDSPVRGNASLEQAVRAVWQDLTDEEATGIREHLVRQLKSGSFHYVLVAQRFATTTEQTVRYLNSVMDARFYAVELVRFAGAGGAAFEARTVLKPERATTTAKAAGGLTDESRFLEGIEGEEYREALRTLLESSRGLGLRIEWGSRGGSIRLPTRDRSEPLTIAWLFPPGGVGWLALSHVTLGYDTSSAAKTPSVGEALNQYIGAVERMPGAVVVKARLLKARELPPEAFRRNLNEIVELLAGLVQQASGRAE